MLKHAKRNVLYLCLYVLLCVFDFFFAFFVTSPFQKNFLSSYSCYYIYYYIKHRDIDFTVRLIEVFKGVGELCSSTYFI